MLNPQLLDTFRSDFKAAVASLEEKYDFNIKLGKIIYLDDRFTAKLTVVEGRNPENAAFLLFKANLWKFQDIGITEDKFKQVFIDIKGEEYALIGLSTNARRYPLQCVRTKDGIRVDLTKDSILFWKNLYYANSFFDIDY